MSKHTQKPWKVDGAYACGKDIGSPSGVSIFEADCCGRIAGKDSDEIEANGRLIVAAPEMYQLIENVAAAYDHDKSSHDLAATLYELRCKALQLLEKLEEGGTA